MIDLYFWTTPNGYKPLLFLEESGIPYRLLPVDISRGEQFKPAFLAISPNNRMPAITDHAPAEGDRPINVFESGAILLYMADKTGRFIPEDIAGRNQVLQWLFWQMAGLGPMLAQNNHFAHYAEQKIPYAIERYVNETTRLFGVLDTQLAMHEYIAGEYSIADMACYPWIRLYESLQQDLDDFPHLQRWFQQIDERPATQRSYAIGSAMNSSPTVTEESRKILFGQTRGQAA